MVGIGKEVGGLRWVSKVDELARRRWSDGIVVRSQSPNLQRGLAKDRSAVGDPVGGCSPVA